MKKIISLILAVLMISVCASCEKDNPENSTSSEYVQDVSSVPIDNSASSEPEESQTETEDNEEYTVEMTAEQQYRANLFLSNFAEQGFVNYDANAGFDTYRLLNFAYMYNKINRAEKDVEYVQEGDRYYSKYSLKNINKTLDRYFNLTLSEKEATEAETTYSFFKDGYYYIEAGDGESYNYLAIVDTLTHLSDGNFKMNFHIYELKLDIYFDNGIADKYYKMTAKEAQNSADLIQHYSGTAIARPYKNGSTDTYQLISYFVNY